MVHKDMPFSLVGRKEIVDSAETAMQAKRRVGSTIMNFCPKSIPGIGLNLSRSLSLNSGKFQEGF